MGDLIMTTPALRALKETFLCHITLLTSSMAQAIAGFIPVIDEVIVRDLPWIKAGATATGDELASLVSLLRSHQFDAAFIFTVYSQSPLPAAMLAMMAGIPQRWAYCRENPYELLTHWIPDREPFQYIKHQVQRDIDLVVAAGAVVNNDYLLVDAPAEHRESVAEKLQQAGIDIKERYVVFHAGVSEEKRQYPVKHWIELGKLVSSMNIPIILTGTAREGRLTAAIAAGIENENVVNWAGTLNIGELIALVDEAAAVVSVNTATIHIAAARQTPVIVLYALTNPQHTPWKVKGRVFPFNVPQELQSKNAIITYVRDHWMKVEPVLPQPRAIAQALEMLLLPTTPCDNISMDVLLL
jgi:ADP-heptose:LPS heptosyltransferase